MILTESSKPLLQGFLAESRGKKPEEKDGGQWDKIVFAGPGAKRCAGFAWTGSLPGIGFGRWKTGDEKFDHVYEIRRCRRSRARFRQYRPGRRPRRGLGHPWQRVFQRRRYDLSFQSRGRRY